MVGGLQCARDSDWYKGQVLYQHQTVVVGHKVRTQHVRQGRAIRGPYRRQVRDMGGVVARGMKQIRSDGNGNIETGHLGQRGQGVGGPAQPKEESGRLPVRVEMALDQPPAASVEQLTHSWNQSDRSLNIFVKEDDLMTFHRHPVAQSTDCIRGKVGYSEGLHVLEFHWPHKQRGTHAVVGVATKEAPLHSPGYQSLVGSTVQSWGWDVGRAKAYHNSDTVPGVPYPATAPSSGLTVPDRFLMVLDMEQGTLAFVSNGVYLGVAHANLKGKTLYPIVSSVWGHCEVTMKYVTMVTPGPPSLASWCRRSIRKSLGSEGVARGDVARLGLPTIIREFLLYR